MNLVLIQRDTRTGRHHPMWYSPAPMPGPGPHAVDRYRSMGHHTTGFDTAEQAQTWARDLAAAVGAPIPDGGFGVHDVARRRRANTLLVARPLVS